MKKCKQITSKSQKIQKLIQEQSGKTMLSEGFSIFDNAEPLLLMESF
jgi:hypothetical protein